VRNYLLVEPRNTFTRNCLKDLKKLLFVEKLFSWKSEGFQSKAEVGSVKVGLSNDSVACLANWA